MYKNLYLGWASILVSTHHLSLTYPWKISSQYPDSVIPSPCLERYSHDYLLAMIGLTSFGICKLLTQIVKNYSEVSLTI